MHRDAAELDQRLPLEIAALLAKGQSEAAACVQQSTKIICSAAAGLAKAIRSGGCIHFAAAGSSALMAATDAQELGGTYSIPARQLHIHMAGGLPTGVQMPGTTEDETDNLSRELAGLSSADVMIAVSASGTTAYTLTAAGMAKDHGAVLIGMANNRHCGLLELADHAILLETPPELTAGSTRMGAATAQKIALNMLSTLMAIELDHVHDGMMVNLHADNTKLRTRANGIVQRIACVSPPVATQALNAAVGQVKPAVLIAARGLAPQAANDLLAATNGHLRAALVQ